MQEIWILVTSNFYDTKAYFSKNFAAALQRRGIKTRLLDVRKEETLRLLTETPVHQRPDLTCSFNYLFRESFFRNKVTQPIWYIFLDPPPISYRYMHAKNLIFSCCDFLDYEDAKTQNISPLFFFGHGVERELSYPPNNDRPYDVVYLGTFYDLNILDPHLRRWTEIQKKLFQRALKIRTEEPLMTDWRAVHKAMVELGIDPASIDYPVFIYLLYVYLRALDRFELIRSIKNATVHVFGGAAGDLKGWPYYFAGSPNVIVHNAIPMEEAVKIMQQSKICLNSMPFFINGTHERLFMGPACGCMMATTDTLWTRGHFGEEMILYPPWKWEGINDKIDYYLAHENERREMAERTRVKVMQAHTWDHRVDELLQILPPILDALKS
jgi:spore maturation protein CgeB